MNRNLSAIAQHSYDVIIIGGGIHGACAAWQCSRQGLKTVLLEKEDFGGGASANSLKIIHGGFRYLQHLNIKRMRESIVSRRLMSRVSPHNVRPLKCVIPNSGWGLRSRWAMRIALLLNDLVAYDRNREVPGDCLIPGGRLLSLQECKRLFPHISWQGKTGGAMWYDALAVNSERLTLDFIKLSYRNGSEPLNYVNVDSISTDTSGKVTGVTITDRLTGKKHTVQGKTVVATGGSANSIVLGSMQTRKQRDGRRAKAVNIIVKRKLVEESAIGLAGEVDYVDKDAVLRKKGRFFFFVPWRGYTMIGTTYSFADGYERSADGSDINKILDEVNTIYAGANLTERDVSFVHVGLVPAYGSENSPDVQLVKETSVVDHVTNHINPVSGLFSVKSVKYTTAPVVAEEVAGKVSSFLGKDFSKKDYTAAGDIPAVDDIPALPDRILHVLRRRYGKYHGLVAKYVHRDDELLCEDPALYGGEVEFFMREEMAMQLADIIFRRSEVGTAELPSDEVLMKVAGRMAGFHNWSEDSGRKQIADIKSRFHSNQRDQVR